MAVGSNRMAYNTVALIVHVVKSFIVQAQGNTFTKYFCDLIYSLEQVG